MAMQVVAALIEKNGRYLLTQRPANKPNAGRWEFPGGKVESGEDPKDTLRREIAEELGITVRVGNVYAESTHTYSGALVRLAGYQCEHLSGEIQKKEVADFAWVPPEQMSQYDITEADLPLVEKLNKR